MTARPRCTRAPASRKPTMLRQALVAVLAAAQGMSGLRALNKRLNIPAVLALRSWTRSPRLWVRLAASFLALQVLMVLVVVLAVLQFRALEADGEKVLHEDVHRMLQVQEISQHAQGHGGAMARLLTAPRPEREKIYAIVDAEYATMDRALTELSQHLSDPETSLRIAELMARRSRYREIFLEVVEAIEFDDLQGARATFNASGQPALNLFLVASNELMASEQAAMEKRRRATQDQIRHAEWLLAALATFAVMLSVLLAYRTTASIAIPLERLEAAALRIGKGEYKGKIDVRTGDEIGEVALAMNAMARAIETRESEIERLAYFDRLSDLPNRAMLRRLARDINSSALSVMLLDVARLRAVNEVMGFETGDALLLKISERLRVAVSAEKANNIDVVPAQLAGGVFAVMCVNLDSAAIERLRDRIDAAVSAPVSLDGHEVDVYLVFGLAAAPDEVDIAIDDLLRRAELAIGECKRTRQPWAWHIAVNDTARARQLSLLSNLRSAAAAGELEMWLQPKECLRTGCTLGMEGLVRWRHPVRGYVSPAEFIPFAERTGHIGVVTQAMMDCALSTLSRWQTQRPELSIAINVSALDIRDMSFPQRLQQSAQRHHAPLARLRLEITESSLMEDTDRVLPVLQAVRDLGVQLSIDDFGTGYSSLAYLHRLPVDELKIDRSFVAGADRHPEARTLLKTIVDLGHSLNMSVTAEGVERQAELQLLLDLGCDVAQGYLISRPMDAAAAERYLMMRSRLIVPEHV